MQKKHYIMVVAVLALLFLPDVVMAIDYTDLTTQNKQSADAMGKLSAPWIKALFGWAFFLGFFVGVGASVAYHWDKAKEERKDKLKIVFISLLAGIAIAWGAQTLTDVIAKKMTGDENAGANIRTTYWKGVLDL